MRDSSITHATGIGKTKTAYLQVSAFYQSFLDPKVTAVFPWETINPAAVNSTNSSLIPYDADHTILYEQKINSTVANLMAYDLSTKTLELQIQVRQFFECSDAAASPSGCRKFVSRDLFNVAYPVGSPTNVCQNI